MHYEPPENRRNPSAPQWQAHSSVDQVVVELSAQLHRELDATQREAICLSTPVETAWCILRAVGLDDFGKIRSRRTAEYADFVGPQHAQAVALALYALGCLRYQEPGQAFDRAAQVLDRAVALAPDNPAYVEAFADVACSITPDDIHAFDDRPHKKLETVIGFNRAGSKATERLLETRFGISRKVITEESGEALYGVLDPLEAPEQKYVARSLNRLAWLFLQEGSFFENGPLLSLAVAASCSHLQSLGLPRAVTECVAALKEAVQSGSVLQDLGDDLGPVCSSLEVLSSAFFKKDQLFRNYGARRRSERIDQLLEAIEGQTGISETDEYGLAN